MLLITRVAVFIMLCCWLGLVMTFGKYRCLARLGGMRYKSSLYLYTFVLHLFTHRSCVCPSWLRHRRPDVLR